MIKKEYSVEQIAEKLMILSGYDEDISETAKSELEDALVWLEAVAENPYNNTCFETLWNWFQAICTADLKHNRKFEI